MTESKELTSDERLSEIASKKSALAERHDGLLERIFREVD